MISWRPPFQSWVALNTDGPVRWNDGLAGCGGLLRDSSGAWICGFAMKIGRASAIVAEIWGVFEGLKLAREKGYRYVEV